MKKKHNVMDGKISVVSTTTSQVANISADLFTRRLNRNAWSGLLTQLATVVIALITTPIVLRSLGNDAYSLLSLATTLIGYFSLADLGLGNAVIKHLAQYDAEGDGKGTQNTVSVGMVAYPLLGSVAGLLLAALAGWLGTQVFNIPQNLQATATLVFYLTSIGLPIVFLRAYFEAIPMAYQKVTFINLLSFGINVSKLLLSLWLVLGGFGVTWIVATNIALTSIQVAVLWGVSLGCLPRDVRLIPRADLKMLVRLLKYGVMMSVTNVSGQLIVNLDKILIAALLPIGALSYYVIAFELASKLWYIPNQIMRAYFPALCHLWSQADYFRVGMHYANASKQIFIGVTFLAGVIFLSAGRILTYWVGADFAEGGTVTLQILALGLMVSCYTVAPNSLIAAAGQPNVTATIHVIVAASNVALAFVLIPRLGINGAALAWLLVHLLDLALLLWWIKSKLLLGNARWFLRTTFLPVISAATLVLAATQTAIEKLADGLSGLIIIIVAGYAVYLLLCFYLAFSREDRQAITARATA